jgi:outer membrane autotransporter protein
MKTNIRIAILAFLVVVFPAALASAQGAPVPDRGAEVAVRTGLALPFGDTDANNSFDQYASSAIPLVVEAGIRVDSHLFVGGRFGYSFANVKNPGGLCDNGASCGGSVVTLGIEGIYRLMPEETFAPWLGLGLGYDWTAVDITAQNVNAGGSATYSGFQGILMAGGDYRVNQQLVLGPAVEASFGRFDTVATQTRFGNATTSMETDITDTAWHTWLTLGIRGAWGF